MKYEMLVYKDSADINVIHNVLSLHDKTFTIQPVSISINSMLLRDHVRFIIDTYLEKYQIVDLLSQHGVSIFSLNEIFDVPNHNNPLNDINHFNNTPGWGGQQNNFSIMGLKNDIDVAYKHLMSSMDTLLNLTKNNVSGVNEVKKPLYKYYITLETDEIEEVVFSLLREFSLKDKYFNLRIENMTFITKTTPNAYTYISFVTSLSNEVEDYLKIIPTMRQFHKECDNTY